MSREIIAVIGLGVLSMLMLKVGDKQFIHLLEGKLFRLGGDVKKARSTYHSKITRSSSVLFVVGCFVVGVAIVLYARSSLFGIPMGIMGAVVFGIGVYGRARAFLAADRELGA